MAYELQKIPYGRKFSYHLSKNDDGTKNGSIIYERGVGHVYCVAKQPRFGDDEEWKQLSELWIDAIETYKKTGMKPSELLKQLQKV